jgi:membrane associated rhomboid family serine protease
MPTNYGNRSGYSPLNMFPSIILWLIGINIAVFIIEYLLLPGFNPSSRLVRTPYGILETTVAKYYFALWPVEMSQFKVWQYLSHLFMHGNFLHIFLNMFGLWMFGTELAQMWGGKRFLTYYLLCGLGAGLTQSLVTYLSGDVVPTVGASGAIFGIMTAFGLTFPDRIIFFFFFPMRAKLAVFVFAAIQLFNGFFGGPSNVAHFAHVGGAVVGFILLKIGGNLTLGGIFDRIPGFGKKNVPGPRIFQTKQQAEDPRIIDVRYRDIRQEEPRRNAPQMMDFGDDQSRIDAILDKISKSGYQNLTDEEKAILFEASKKMR